MAAPYSLAKTFNAWQGLDLRSSDITRESVHATALLNCDYRKTGAMNKRKGAKSRAELAGGNGLFTYLDLDTVTGAQVEKLISVSDTLHVLSKGTLTLNYTGSETAYCNVYPTAGEYFLDLYEDNTRVLNFSLGVGYDEAGTITIADLKVAIDALVDFSCTITGDDTRPAAFLDIKENLTIDTSADINFYEWEDSALPTGLSTPLSNLESNKSDPLFENATFANMNGVLYVASRYTDLHKYDGTRFYKAGLPSMPDPSLALNGAGNVPGTPEYIAVYRYTDAKGNIITGIQSQPVSIAAGGSQVDVTLDNIEHGSGFDTDGSIVIELYRNKSGGLRYFLVEEITNDPTAPTQVYTDNKIDDDLGVAFIEPLKSHGLPPRMSYITTYQGLLVGTGNPEDVNNVYYSDIDSPEYFPAESNAFLIESNRGDKNTGIAPLGNALFIFRENSIHQVLGNLADDTFSTDYYGNAQIGTTSHHSISEVNGFLMFLSRKGVFALNQNNQEIEEVSRLIEPLFTDPRNSYDFTRAVSYHWISKDKYLLYLPVLDNNGAATSESRMFCYDYVRQAWIPWGTLNACSGFTLFNDRLWFQENNFSSFGSTITHKLWQFQETGTRFDYADHTAPIEFTYKSHWEHLGEPSVFKKFVRCKTHSLDSTLDDFESDSFTMLFQTELDWVNNVDTQRTLDFGGGQDGWGASQWGLFPWGNERLNSVVTKLKNMKCKAMRLTYSNDTINENILISGIEMEVAATYQRAIKE